MSNKFIYVTASMCVCVLSMLLCCFTGMGILLCEQRQQELTLEIGQLKDDVALLSDIIKEHNDIMTTYQFFNEHWDAVMRGEASVTQER